MNEASKELPMVLPHLCGLRLESTTIDRESQNGFQIRLTLVTDLYRIR